jgi:Mn2+/Fe2+ NRAMP family transporter
MGDFAARGWVKWAGWGSAILIAALNAWMLWGLLAGAVGGGAGAAEGAPAG